MGQVSWWGEDWAPLNTYTAPTYFLGAALQPSSAYWPELTTAVGSDSGSGLKWPAGHRGRKRGAGRASLCVSHGQR